MSLGKVSRRAAIQGTALSLISPPSIFSAAAQQATRVVYPFSAGGAGDGVGRIVADQIGAGMSVATVVENRTGAAGRMGTKSVSIAEPDGTTLLFVSSPAMSIYPHVYPKLEYDPIRDFAPISLVATFDVALAVWPGTNVKTIAELISWAKQNPEKANYGSPGAGGIGHFFAVMFALSVGVDFRHVSYRGANSAVTDLVSGQIPIAVVTVGDVVELHRAGRVRVLAISGGERTPLLPEVPTFKEAGVSAEGQGWYAVYAPAKTSVQLIDQINKVIVSRLAISEVRERLLKLNVVPKTSTPQELAEFQINDTNRWAPVVKASGFTSQL